VDFGTLQTDRLKRNVVIDTVSALARLLTRHGNRVGAMFYADGVGATIPARGGRLQVLRLIDLLLDQPRLAGANLTDLTPLIDDGRRRIKRRSLVFIVSDFISQPGWERSLNLLNRRHEVIAIRVWDPREIDLPDVGPLLLQDAETGEQLLVDTHDAGFRRRFRAAADAREAALAQTFKRAGVEAQAISTDEDLVQALVRIANRRRRRRN
jgi:uncharacterized protein (DUF58 family)